MATPPTAEILTALSGPTSDITSRAEIYESDGITRWSGDDGVRLIGGSVSVDYSRDERRSMDLMLDNKDNLLEHDPDGGFWYDKIIKLYKGVSAKVYKIAETLLETITNYVTDPYVNKRNTQTQILRTNLVANPRMNTNATGWAHGDRTQAADPGQLYFNPYVSGSACVYYRVTTGTRRRIAVSAIANNYASWATETYTAFPLNFKTPTEEVGDRRYVMAKNGPGDYREDAGFNQCPNPMCNSVTGFVAISSSSVTASPTDPWSYYLGTNTFVHVVRNNTTDQRAAAYRPYDGMWVFAGRTYTFSALIRGATGQGTTGVQVAHDPSLVPASAATQVAAGIASFTGRWGRTWQTFTVTTSGWLNVSFYSQGAYATTNSFDIGMMQLEESPEFTSWMHGYLGTGYSWETTYTNLFTVAQAAFEDGTVAGWTAQNANHTVANSTAQSYSQGGTRSLLLTRVNTTVGGGAVSPAVTVAASTEHVLSLEIHQAVATPLRIYVKDAGNSSVLVSYDSAGYAVGWKRFALYFNSGTSTSVKVYVTDDNNAAPTNGAVIYIDGVLLEANKRYPPTTFNAMGAGSCTSKRLPKYVSWTPATAPTVNNLTLIAQTKLHSLKNITGTLRSGPIGTHTAYTKKTRIEFYQGAVYAYVQQGGTTYQAVLNGINWVLGDTFLTMLTYDGTTLKIYISKNGAAAQVGQTTVSQTGDSAVSITVGSPGVGSAGGQWPGPVENAIACNGILTATDFNNLISGAMEFGEVADRADCIFSAYLNEIGASSSGLSAARGASTGRFGSSVWSGRTTDMTDVVLMSTGSGYLVSRWTNVMLEVSYDWQASYFDGATAAGGDYIYAWTGSTDASTSTQKGYQATNYVTSSNCIITSSSDWANDYSWSLKLIPDGYGSSDSYATLYVLADVTAMGLLGKTVTMNGYLKLLTAQGGTIDGRARSIVAYTTAPSDNAGQMRMTQSTQGPNDTTVNRLSVTFTIPADVTYVSIRLYNGSMRTQDAVYWDSLALTDTATLYDFFTGATVDPNFRFAWTGLADASTSTRKKFEAFSYYETQLWETQVGQFLIDNLSESHFPHQMKVTGRDYAKQCMLSKFIQSTTFVTGQSIDSLVSALATNAGITRLIVPTTGKSIAREFAFERNTSRWEAMKLISNSYGYELYFDAQGYLVMREYQDPVTSPLALTLETGEFGNLVSYEKSTNDSRIFNHVGVVGESSDTAVLPVFAEKKNTNPASPTRIARLGTRYTQLENSLITTVPQAQDVADKFIRINALEEYDLNFSAISFPWMEVGEITQFTDPRAIDEPDRFLLSSLSIPMGLGPMSGNAKRVAIVG